MLESWGRDRRERRRSSISGCCLPGHTHDISDMPRSSRPPHAGRAGLVVGVLLGKAGYPVQALVPSVTASFGGCAAPSSALLQRGRPCVRRRPGDMRLSAGGDGAGADVDSSELYADMRRRLEVRTRERGGGGGQGSRIACHSIPIRPDSKIVEINFRTARVLQGLQAPCSLGALSALIFNVSGLSSASSGRALRMLP